MAVVLMLGAPESTLWVSPFTKPEYAPENEGFAAPYALLALFAVTVSVALPIVRVPFAKLKL